MKTEYKNKLTIQKSSNMELISELEQKTDYELRKILCGFGITLACYCRQFNEPGTEEYEAMYKQLFEKINILKEKCYTGLKKYDVTVLFNSGKNQYTYSGSYEERNEAEAIQRAKERVYTNTNGRKIKPKFLSITATEAK